MDLNRRASERLKVNSPIRYQRKGSQRFERSVSKDISASGIGFSSNEFLPVATQLIFDVQNPDTQDFTRALGEVVWVSNDPHSERFLVGAKFIQSLRNTLQ